MKCDPEKLDETMQIVADKHTLKQSMVLHKSMLKRFVVTYSEQSAVFWGHLKSDFFSKSLSAQVGDCRTRLYIQLQK